MANTTNFLDLQYRIFNQQEAISKTEDVTRKAQMLTQQIEDCNQALKSLSDMQVRNSNQLSTKIQEVLSSSRKELVKLPRRYRKSLY